MATPKQPKVAVLTATEPIAGASQGVLDPEGIDEIRATLDHERIQAEIAASALDEKKRLKVLQEIKVDAFTTLRRWVDLTPSMCRVRGCPFDAAKAAGYQQGWNEMVERGHEEMFGERIKDYLAKHTAVAHVVDQAHIKSADEIDNAKQWAGVPGGFLTGAGQSAAR